MVKRNRLFSICIMVLAVGIWCVFPPAGAQAKDVYKLTFADQHPMEAPMNKVVNTAWIKWLDQASGGKVKVTLYPSETAAKAPDLYDAARDGLVDMSCQLIAMAPGRYPLLEVLQLPLIFNFPGSRPAALTAMALFEKYPEIQAEVGEGKAVKIIGFHANGPSHVHTVKKQIKKLEDLKGLILQGTGASSVAAIKALGATPETLMPGESYDAMAKGVVDADLIEWEGQFIWKINELTNYSTQVGLNLLIFIHCMNLDTYNSLPPEIQKLFIGDNAKLISTLHGYNFDKDDSMFKKMLDKQYKAKGNPGVYVLPDEERARWIAAVKPVWDQWVKKASKKVGEAKAKAILEDAQKFSKQFSGLPDDACPTCKDTLKKWGAPGY
ncbi:MAG: TRAP transporter substrate-binding protein [Deltaproteobacteria bacterium]|nr:TRAP transporter substrate-binding protein [Deltaproteobacteria bacterium]